jgi:hypothetical protein
MGESLQSVLPYEHLDLGTLAYFLFGVDGIDRAENLSPGDPYETSAGGHVISDGGRGQVRHANAVPHSVFVGLEIRQDYLAARQLHVADH